MDNQANTSAAEPSLINIDRKELLITFNRAQVDSCN